MLRDFLRIVSSSGLTIPERLQTFLHLQTLTPLPHVMLIHAVYMKGDNLLK